MIVKTTKLTKHYGLFKKFKAVDSINMNIEENSIYGLLGPNGAGKTTTLGMLTTLVHPTSGDAEVCGFSVSKDPEKVKKMIGILPQHSNFYPNRTGLDNVMYYARLAGLNRNDARVEANKLLDYVGLKSKKNVKTKHYSHGMVKLTAIAQALIGDPKVIFLDEPLSGLDPQVVHKTRELIKSLKKKATVVFSSHNLDEVERICDHVGIIHHGKLVEENKISKIRKINNVITFNISNIAEEMIKSVKKVRSVKTVKQVGSTLVVCVKGKNDITSNLLKELSKKKADITEVFKGKNLEEVFMEHVDQ